MEQKPLAAVSGLNKMSVVGAWVGGLGLLIAACLIVTDLVFRKMLGWSIGGADEIAGYVLAIASAWAFPIALLRRSHIRVDVLYAHLPRKAKVALDLFALASLGVFIGALTFHSWGVLSDSISFGSVSNTALQISQWIPQSLWLTGYLFFFVTIAVLFLCSVWLCLKNRLSEVGSLIGIHSVEEEIDKELNSEH